MNKAEKHLIEKLIATNKEKMDIGIIINAIKILSAICVGSEREIIYRLSGYLWDEDEANKIINFLDKD